MGGHRGHTPNWKWREGFMVMMDYWSELSPESQIELDKRLKELDL